MLKNVFHSGAIGDLICSLPYLLSTGDKYNLFISQNFEIAGVNSAKTVVEGELYPYIKTFFERQPFINSIKIYNGEKLDQNLDDFRKIGSYRLTSLHKMYFYKFGGHQPMEKPWIFNIEPVQIPDRDIIVSRTFRQVNTFFPHNKIIEKYGNRIAFIGWENEYERYKKEFDFQAKTTFIKIKNLYEAAQIIYGSKLCISSGTAFLHIAQGLNKKRIFDASLTYNGVWISSYLEGDILITEIEAQNHDYVLEKVAICLDDNDNTLPKKEESLQKHSTDNKPLQKHSIDSKPLQKQATYELSTTRAESSSKPLDLPIHFFTIVQNGEPFIRYHMDIFLKLPFRWHWHVVEGIADLKHDSAWVLRYGGRISDDLHNNGRSVDSTTSFLDWLVKEYPEHVTVYRKPEGVFWDGKREMVNAPIINIQEECLLWQIDVDELWTVDQICTCWKMFIENSNKTAAYYWCNYFVGEDLIIKNRHCYGNHENEWLRTWRFKPGSFWAAHEPPVLVEPIDEEKVRNIASVNPFMQNETEKNGLVFQHYAYVMPAQLEFKERYYGYKGAVHNWNILQSQSSFPVMLRDYFHWVNDNSIVEKVDLKKISPIVQRSKIENNWIFKPSKEITIPTKYQQLDRSSISNNLGLMYQNNGKIDIALHFYEQSLKIKPDNPFALCNIGKLKHESGDIDEAIKYYELSLRSKNDTPEAWNNLGLALHRKNRLMDAITCYETALSIRSEYSDALNNMGFAYEKLRKPDDAITFYKRAINIDPNSANAHTNMAISYLLMGNYEDGLKEYEWRFKKQDFPIRNFNKPQWDGSSLKDNTLLVHPEQGFGDTLHFIRYIPMIKQQKGGKIVVETHKELKRLFENIDGIDYLFSKNEPIPDFDCHVPLISLPFIFGTNIDTIPADIPYLTIPENPKKELIDIMSKHSDKFKLGIVWSGGDKHKEDHLRSCRLADFNFLSNFKNISVFSFQKGKNADLLKDNNILQIEDIGKLNDDFADTAYALSKLDLLITVDTAIVHLAGAIGLRTWLILPYAPDWRWLLDRFDSPWYPTIKIFRQPKQLDFKSVMINIENELNHVLKFYKPEMTEKDYHQTGVDLYNKQEYFDAIQCFQAATCKSLKYFQAWNDLGATYEKTGNILESITCYKQFLSIDSKNPIVYRNLGIAYKSLRKIDNAIWAQKKAIEFDPEYYQAYNELGVAYEKIGNLDEAIKMHKKALSINPDFPNANKDLSMVYLLKGDLIKGFEGFEWRFKCDDFSSKLDIPVPFWDGSDFKGKKVLLYSEQGFGDIIQFVRYAPFVKQRGGEVIIGTFENISELIKTVDGVDRVFSQDYASSFDFKIPLLSLPRIFKTDLNTIPSKVPYIKPPKENIKLKKIIQKYNNTLKIGFVWAGSDQHKEDNLRSMSLTHFEILFPLQGFTFFSLQKGKQTKEFMQKNDLNIIDLDDYLSDFSDTAYAISLLDLVISVDTSIAHIAGALAKPVWTLLPFAPDWRWMLKRNDSPWYPTMKLFRQSKFHDWFGVIQNVKNKLIDLKKNKSKLFQKPIEQDQSIITHAMGYFTGFTGYNIHTRNFFNEMKNFVKLVESDLQYPEILKNNLSSVLNLYKKENIANIAIEYGNGMHVLKSCPGLKIGYTVWESTKIPDDWIEPLRIADKIWTPSSWGKKIFVENGIDEEKISVVPEGIDTKIFNPDIEKLDNIVGIKGFKFLHVGKYEDRKFTRQLITAFDDEFQHDKDVVLLLSCHNPFVKNFDIHKTLNTLNIKSPEKIKIIHPVATHQIFASLYVSADAFLFPTRAEGWGLPIIEAMACGLPVIVTNYSGQTEFINDKNAYTLDYTLEDIKTPYFYSKNKYYGKWAKPDIDHFRYLMRYIFENQDEAKNKGLFASKDILENWTWNKSAKRAYNELLKLL